MPRRSGGAKRSIFLRVRMLYRACSPHRRSAMRVDGATPHASPGLRFAYGLQSITHYNSEQPCVIARILLSAPGRPSSPSALSKREGMARQAARHFLCAHLVAKVRRLPARHRRRFFGTGPRFRRSHEGSASSASSWRRVIVPASGAPAPPERVRCVKPHARGRRIADVGFTRYRPSKGGSIIETPRDDALSRAGREEYKPVQRAGDKFFGGRNFRGEARAWLHCPAGAKRNVGPSSDEME
jgi:hypothetical protein